MLLSNIKKVTFEEVLQKYSEDHKLKDEEWEKRNLRRANKKFGNWILAEISMEDICEIIMPHYKHENLILVPFEGLTLLETYQRFKQNYKEIQQNAIVRKKIEFHKKNIPLNGIKSIYLSQEPLFHGLSYTGLTQHTGKITHLDGFHRLMALMELQKKPKFIDAYIAVYPHFFSEQ